MITKDGVLLGDLNKLEVKIDGNDVTQAVSVCQVWQDISAPTWSCSIAMDDRTNMIHLLPIKQGSKLKIKFETKFGNQLDGEAEFEFILYKISDRLLVKSRHQTYVIHGVTEAFLKNQGKRISKHFKKKPDAIIKEIISEKLEGSVDGGGADHEIECIIPNWSPFVAAQWLCKLAVKNKTADFVFFQTDKDKYKMESVETLYGDSCGIKLTQGIADKRDANSNIEEGAAYNITSYFIEHFDGITNLCSGYYASQMVYYDLLKHIWRYKEFKFGDDVGEDKGKKGWTGEFFEESKNASISYVPIHKEMYKANDEQVYKHSDEWLGSRKVSVMRLDQDRLFVQIPGGAKMWKYLGKSIEVDLSSHEDMTGEKMDKYYRGKYLIVAINHNIQDSVYNVNLELVKLRLEKGM